MVAHNRPTTERAATTASNAIQQPILKLYPSRSWRPYCGNLAAAHG